MTETETKLSSATKMLASAIRDAELHPTSGKSRGRVTVIREEIRRLEQQLARAAARRK